MGLLETLVLGSYAFTAALAAAGGKAFHYLYKLVSNHHEHRLEALEKRLAAIEERDP